MNDEESIRNLGTARGAGLNVQRVEYPFTLARRITVLTAGPYRYLIFDGRTVIAYPIDGKPGKGPRGPRRRRLELVDYENPQVGRRWNFTTLEDHGPMPRSTHRVEAIEQYEGDIANRLTGVEDPAEIEIQRTEVETLLADGGPPSGASIRIRTSGSYTGTWVLVGGDAEDYFLPDSPTAAARHWPRLWAEGTVRRHQTLWLWHEPIRGVWVPVSEDGVGSVDQILLERRVE